MQYPWPHPSTMEAGFSRLSAGGMYPGHFHPSMAPLAPPHDQNGPLYGQYLHSGPASSQPQSSVLARLYEAGKGLMNGSHGSPGFGGLHLHATSRHSAASASVSQAPDQKDVSRSIKSSQQPKESERSSRDHSSKERERTVKSEENKSSSDSNHVRHGDSSSKHDLKSNATNLSDSTKKETSSSSSEKTGHSSAKSDGDSAVKLAATTEKKNTIPMSVLDKKKAHARSPDLHSKEPPKPTPTDSGKLGQTEHGSSGEVGVAGTSNSATTTAAPVHTVAPTHKSQPSQHGNGKSVTTVTTTSSSFQPRMTYYSHSIQAQPEKETRKSLVCAQTYIPPLENGEQPNTFLARKLKSSAHQDKSRSNSPVSKASEAAGGSDKSGSGTDSSSNSRTEVLAIPVGDARGPSELNGHAASRAAEPRAAPNGERTKSSSEPSSRRHSPNSDRKSEESSKSSSSCEQSAGRTSGNAPSQDRRDKDAAPGASGPQKDMIRIHDYPYRDIIHEYGQPRSAVTLHDAPATVYSHSEAPEMRHLSQMSGLHPEGARMHPEWRMPGSCASAASHMAALAAQHGYLTPDHPKFLEFYPNKDRSFLERSWPPTPFSQDSNHDRHRSSEPGKPDTKPASGSSSQPEGPSTHEHSPRESTQEKCRHQDRPSPQHRDVAKTGKTSKSTTPSPAPSSKSETAEENTPSRKTEKQQVSDKAEKVPAVGESSPYSASVAGKGIEGRRPPVGIAVAQQRAGTEGAPSETGAPAGTGQSASNSAATTDRGTRASRPENADSSSDESEIPPRAPADRCQSAPSAHHDKDREQFLREQRELAAEMALRTKPQGSREVMNDLSGNLVVTGGASLPSNSPWASSLASHPHVPPHMVTRGSPAPAMWFSHYPYPGLSSHPPPPGVGLEPGALPLAPHGGWQLARDPVTGGLVLVPPGTPLANPGGHQRREMLERQQQLVWSSGSAPPPPSHLQHAHHLQLMSQQHQHQQHMELLRQQELRHAEQYQIALHQHHAQEEQKRWEAEEKRKQDQEKQQQQQAEKCGTPRTWAHEDPALEKAGRAAMEAYLQAGIPVAGQPPYGPFPYPHPPYQYIYDQPALMRLVSSSAGSSTVTTTESSRDKEQAAVTTTTSVHTSVSPSVSVSSQSGKQREEADAKKSTEQTSKEEPSSVSKAAKDTEKSVAKQAIETSTQTTPEPERMQPIDQPLASSKAPPTDFQPIKTEGVTPHHGTEAESTQAIVPSSTEERPRSPPQATVCSQSQATSVEQSTESVGTSVAATSVEKPVVTKTEMPTATPQQQTQLREMSVQAETMVTSVTVSTMAVTMSKSMVTTSLQNVDPELLQATEGMALLSRLAEEKSRSESGVAAVKVKVERQSVTMASVCTSMAAAAAAMTTDMSQHEGTGPEDSLVHSWGRWKWRSNLKLPQKEEQGTGSAFKLQSGPEGMDLVELEMRMKLAELQRRYKEKQRELARLQRKREKKRKKENGPVKRGPGRPRKRRFHQNSPKSSVKSGEGPSKVERRSKSPKGALHLLVEEMESEEPPKKKKKVTKDSAQQPAAPTSKPKGKKGKGKETAAPDEQEVKLEPPKSKKSKKSDNQPTKKGAKASSAVSSGTNKKSAKDDGTTSKHKPKVSTSSDTTSEESGGKSKGKSGSNSNKNTGAEEKTQTQKGKGKKKDKDSQASATSTTKGTGQGSKKSKDKTTTSNTPSRKRSFSLTQSLPQSDDSDDDLVNEDVFWSSLPHPTKAPSSKTSPKTTKKSKDGSKPKKKQKTEDSKVKVPKVKKTVTPKAKPKKVDEGSDSDSDEDDFSRRSHSEADDWSDADLDIDTMTYSETSGLGLLAKYAASSAASMPIAPSTSKKRKKPSNNDDADDEAPATEVKGSKKRKPTQPSKKTTTSTSDTPTPKKPKKSKNTSTEGKVSRPKKKKVKEPEPVEDEVPLLDDDAWARRRTKAATPSSKASPVPSGKTASSTPSGKVKKTKTEKNEETSTKPSSSKKTKDSTKETPTEPLVHPGDAPVSKPKKKTSKASKAAKEDATQTKKASKPKAPKKTPSTSTPTEAIPSTAPPKAPKVKASTPVVTSPPPLPAPPLPPALPTPTPMEQDSVSNESFSDGENLPLSNYVDQQRPSTPEPRLVNIQKEELRDGLRVIIPIDGLFHTGYVDEIQPPDVYGAVIDGQRGHRPQVYSQEQILQEALHDVKPGSVRFLPEGARVCAYWSQQYRCLYPGTVARMSPSPDGSDDDKTFVSVEFDDGDSGRIPLDHVRLLPPNYPVVGKERGDFSMNPIMLHGKRRRRSGDVSKDGLSDAKGDTSDTDSSTVLMDQKEVDNVVSQPEKTKAPTKKASTAQSRAKKGKAKSESVLPLLLDYDSYTGDLGVISEEEEEDGRSSSRKSSPKNSPKASPARSSSAGSTSKKSKKSNSGEKASKLKSKDSKKEPKVKLDSDEKPSPIPKSKTNSEKFSKPSTASEDQKPTKSSKKEKKVSSDVSDESASTKGEKKKTAGDTTTTKKTKKAKKAESSDTGASDSTPAKKTTKKDAAKQAKKDTGAQETQKSQKGKASDVTTKAKASSAKVAPPDFEEESNLDDSEAQSFADSNSIAPSNVTSDVEDDDDISEDTRSERSEDIKKPTKKPPARGSKTRRRSADKTPSVESRSKIAPFLPARQLWRWSGKSTQRRGVKGKGKKVFYKAIQRGHEIIRVGDSAVFMSTGRPNLPYVGRIENLWESWGGNMVVKVKWFYHPEETIVGRRACDGKMALYQSSHVDENDVQTISHRCEVVSPDEYERKAKSKRNQDDLDDLYYCAGTYDPTNGALQNVSGPL
ncbi:PREDICTED: trinucleotide repeat-containing gene 18 protein-like [Branchiostoma belcheri]|uniref:Trinucleotide repeat-containing gene 18 protein-like n=1 Tax=Branchiostoma belcheri TaxID=7741 RepID=A0A6P5AIF4_BRABE|nr:PREDICTED: trinucleotide repeat-containing gene 18 protein-like [Branchiostoma belcheri]